SISTHAPSPTRRSFVTKPREASRLKRSRAPKAMLARRPAASRARHGTAHILTTPRASAYIKIAEGCDHPCSFCIIPQLRGKFRSRPLASIVAETQHLIAQGVREITLIGQDTTCYGEDLAPDAELGRRVELADLLNSLAPLPGLKWLRFLYAYPNKITTRLLETIARHDNIAKYLDVPLQHASANVLRRMKRGGSAGRFLEIID